MIFNIPVGGKRSVVVSVYGAANETITLAHSNGTVFSVKHGGIMELPYGTYTVTGGISKYSKTATVNKNTTRINAWPDGATIYYWYGYKPIGNWAAIASVPSTSPYHDAPIAPQISESTNSVSFNSQDSARGGTVYLPKTTIKGNTMTLLCGGAVNEYYLALNLCPDFSWAYTPGAVANISSGTTKVNMSIASVSGGSYHPAISMNTKRDPYDPDPSKITVYALYSV